MTKSGLTRAHAMTLVRDYIDEQGISIRSLARRMDMDPRYLTKQINGERLYNKQAVKALPLLLPGLPSEALKEILTNKLQAKGGDPR